MDNVTIPSVPAAAPTPAKPQMVIPKPSAEQIAQSYSALFHSVKLIESLMAKEGTPTAEDLDTVSRNAEHLAIMAKKDWWTTEDFTEVNQCLEDSNVYLVANGRSAHA